MTSICMVFIILVLVILAGCTNGKALDGGRTASEKHAPDVPTSSPLVKGPHRYTTEGIGVIVLSKRYGRDDFVRIYNEDGSIWYEFTYYYDDSDNEFEYYNENFEPVAFHPDYFLLTMKCTGEGDEYYEVVVNEEEGLKKFVSRNDRVLRLESWENHILGLSAVGFDREANPLRDSPAGEVRPMELTTDPDYHPIEIKGEWLKVGWNHAGGKQVSDNTGWIRWKENNQLLVELGYFA